MSENTREKNQGKNQGRNQGRNQGNNEGGRTNGVSRMSLPVLLGSLAAVVAGAVGVWIFDPTRLGVESVGHSGGIVLDISWKVIRTSMAVISFQFIDRYLLLDFHIADALHSDRHPVAVRSVMVGSWMLLLCTFLYVFAVL